ncbi:MAG: nucleotidyl transferase AbiEii/AbiGii toxin family protein [Deltaproteobacteria bacterium]|nr:nucleotidyl transferase AbiEii/AbiGii toxin family protein [Deltaproteobacteria bacterium]
MNDVITRMIERYECQNVEDYVRALREILQEIALLGLWRSKFFEKAAFYGGTALRILYGMDRFSEDLDFSLLKPMPNFDISRYMNALEREIRSFGFEATATVRAKKTESPIHSAFLKADTLKHVLVIETAEEVARQIPRGQAMKIKIEVDTDPPPGFVTENKFILHPIPFSVRTFVLPDLFAGKMHAVLCRRWKSRVKGRDWYDLVWYAANYPQLHLDHLKQRMIQSGNLEEGEDLTGEKVFELTSKTIERLDVNQVKREVEPFVKNPEVLEVWSKEFFQDVVKRIELV